MVRIISLYQIVLILNDKGSLVYRRDQIQVDKELDSYHTFLLSHSCFITFSFNSIISRCTSGTTKPFEFVFHSHEGIKLRLQWMQLLIKPLNIQKMAVLAATHFIDCITVTLDALINHIPLCIPAALPCTRQVLQDVDLVRVTPSFLSTFALSSTRVSHVFLSGERLLSSTLHYLQTCLPDAQFYNVYGGMINHLVRISFGDEWRLFLLSMCSCTNKGYTHWTAH